MNIILKNGLIISGSGQTVGDIFIEHGTIVKIAPQINKKVDREINCTGKLIFPGMIDTHVHFRDPGLTQKGDSYTESMAAVAGGVTTICDMPNTLPNTLTIELVRQKQDIYQHKCLCNFGIYIGASKDNLAELKKADEDDSIPAIKIFMAESTGNMTLYQDEYLEPIFKNTKKLIAVHAEDEKRRLQRLKLFTEGKLSEGINITKDDPYQHCLIRDNEVAVIGTKHAIELALKYKHRTHILHMSAKEELTYLASGVKKKLVTAETCPHYLWFNRENIKLPGGGNYLIMNPSLKGQEDNEALWKAVQVGVISQITTDHAPHLRSAKELPYGQAPAGVPGIQFVFPLLLQAVKEGRLTYQHVARLTAENPAKNYRIKNKGFLKVGFDADITIVNPNRTLSINNRLVLSKCGWTPYTGMNLKGGVVEMTIVNGNIVLEKGRIFDEVKGNSIVVSSKKYDP